MENQVRRLLQGSRKLSGDSYRGVLGPSPDGENRMTEFVQYSADDTVLLRAATLYPVEYFKMSDRAGIIKAGYKADLVIIGSNPLESIKALRDISLVLAQSRVYSRKDFSTMRSRIKGALSN